MALEIDQLRVGRFGVFCYVVTESGSREAMIVDPGAEADRILERIRDRDARPRWIVCTHAHPDHVGAVSGIKRETGAALVMHSEEARVLGRLTHRIMVRLTGGRPAPMPDLLVRHGDRLEIGSCEARVLHTPGHSTGGICLLAEGNLFSGDTLFIGSVGRTDLPGCSWAELTTSLREKVLSLPGDTRIWPGHDYGPHPTRLLTEERRENPFLRQILAAHGGETG
jgi:hydroxyacylglutathione hydrolase